MIVNSAVKRAAAISVSGLGKKYRVWHRPADMLLEALAFKRRHIEFEALSDVSFEILPGTVTGIMGRNGAGKSTLLRIVAGTLDATAGSVAVTGRISAILELGTGFSPDYTGRENIYLGGMCLGLSRREISQRFDEIVKFAEVGEFIDQPFRTFSSGMKARLTFSVATCVDPDILIVDEALSVGDARFQVKSFDRIREFKRRGKSILLVSHDMNQIASICDRAILLERGRVIADGIPQKVCNIYHELLFAPTEVISLEAPEPAAARATAPATTRETFAHTADTPAHARLNVPNREKIISDACSPDKTPDPVPVSVQDTTPNPVEHRYGDAAARIVSIEITTPGGEPISRLTSLETYRLVCRIRAEREVGPLVFGWLLRDKRGLDLFGWDMQTGGCPLVPRLAVGEEFEIVMLFCAHLGAGSYFITPVIASVDKRKHDVRFDALEISVDLTTNLYTTSVVNLEPRMANG